MSTRITENTRFQESSIDGTNGPWYEKSGHPIVGWSKKRRDDGTDDGTPGGRYAVGHCPVVV